MSLVTVLLELIAVQLLALSVTAMVVVGPERLRRTARELPQRLRAVAGPVAVLAVVLLVNAAVRELVPVLSWVVGLNLTPYIYAIEGDLVASIQSHATPAATAVLSYVYVYGYVFLLVFPLVAYVALSDREPLQILVVAYTANYVLGLVLYLLVIAYGPRNLLAASVDSLLFDVYPQFQLLTSRVNENTNVFPSLHTSLSTTVVGVAYLTRREYPDWLALAIPLALAVLLSTMYLGIHWATDVVAGVGLGVVAVWIGCRYVSGANEEADGDA